MFNLIFKIKKDNKWRNINRYLFIRNINNYDIILLVVKCVPMNKQIISHIVLRNYW